MAVSRVYQLLQNRPWRQQRSAIPISNAAVVQVDKLLADVDTVWVVQHGGDPDTGLVPVHIGYPPPTRWDEMDTIARVNATGYGETPPLQRRPEILAQQLDWVALGGEPRWLGTETSDCAAAISPSIFHNHGADELKRFLAGAATRGETAVLLSTLGAADEERVRSVLSSHDASVLLTSHGTSTYGVSADGCRPVRVLS